MSLFACCYAVVQFLPYAETGEFANVGIALLCPEKAYFGFRLQSPRRTRRITQFFERLDRAVYVRAIEAFQQELQRTSQFLNNEVFPAGNSEGARQAFGALTHPREAILRFAPQRALMSAAPEQELDKLFNNYVEHEFATAEHREAVLEKRIAHLAAQPQPAAPLPGANPGQRRNPRPLPLCEHGKRPRPQGHQTPGAGSGRAAQDF